MIGALLGNRYELIELVGTGGMANVYKAKCTLLNRHVAVKILKDEFKDDDEFVKRFNIESQAAAGLSHNNIVSVYDVGTQDDIHYIVMEYVEGITLKEYLKQNGVPDMTTAVDFSIQIASALQHAHRKGIVHRDIKPQNIIVTKDGVLKVTDFGIARAVSTFTMKVDDSTFGTAHYCSPEQARGGYTDEKSDIYSLGVVMYEMFTGKLPFESESSVTVALKHIQEEPTLPKEINPEIPLEIQEVILKTMKKDQNERFQTASEVLIELNWIKQSLSGAWGNKQDAKTPSSDEFETKVINVKEVEELSSKSDNKKKSSAVKEQKNKKEDRIAAIAAIITSVVLVAVVSVICINAFFPDLFSFGVTTQNGELEVPDLLGLDFESAKKKYKDISFEEEAEYSTDYDEGRIISQDPESGVRIKEPYTVKVVVSKGVKTVKVPNVVNLDYRQAKLQMEENDISCIVEYEINDEIPENIVVKVSPDVGETVRADIDLVTLYVSSGREEKEIIVPNVMGEKSDNAEKLIVQSGLTVTVKEEDSVEPKGTVIKQSIAGNSQVSGKTNIVITVSTGNPPAGEEVTEPEPGPSTPSGSVKEVTVMLPNNKENVVVKVTLDGSTVYENTHKSSEGAVSVPVSGTGSGLVATYVDGVKIGERKVQF